MPLPQQVLNVRNELAEHLKKFDWANLTTGRKNILEAFLRVATTEGYAAVTMRSLGKALNVKPPSIYSHFPYGRDEIVAECLRWHYYNFGVAVLEAVSSAETDKAFLNALVTVHLTHQLTRPENALWDMLVASDRIGNFLQPAVRDEVNYWLMLCIRLYESVGQSYCHENLSTRSAIVMSLLDGATFWGKNFGSDMTIDQLCEEAILTVYKIFGIGTE